MKPENKQRFSIRKYAIGAASVLPFRLKLLMLTELCLLQQRINLLSKPLEKSLHLRQKLLKKLRSQNQKR